MRRAGYMLATCLGVAGVTIASLAPTPVRLIWNATASTPVGFYIVHVADALQVTDLVAVRLPENLAGFVVERGYVGHGVPLLKRVVGLPGQRVCRTGRTISVDGVPMGEALERDRRGRDLPVWRGCRRIAADALFLMNWNVADSLDGRYFGPLSASFVIGRALPLWTDEHGDGRFHWRAPTR